MQWDVTVKTNGEQSYSDTGNITTLEYAFPNYSYCLPRYARLDGKFENAPDKIEPGRKGYISLALSGADGEFGAKPVIEVELARKKTSNGIRLVFNQLSGDYASRVTIEWYKGEEMIAEKDFLPASADYFCAVKVPLFDRFRITFHGTNKPYRYLWIGMIQNRRMTDAGGLKIVYDDIALGAKDSSVPVSDDRMDYVSMENLKEDTIEFPNHSMCLPRYARMDGSYENAPDKIVDIGYVSKSISDATGSFAVPPVIDVRFGELFSSVGITLQFNDYSQDYCSLVNIRWYQDNRLLAEKDFEPDGYLYFCYHNVDYYNRVAVTFLKTSKPFRNVFLTRIDYGLQRIFRDDEIKEIECYQEINAISEEVSINVLNFTVRSRTDIMFNFQKRQQMRLYFDEAILGVFYLQAGSRRSATDYRMETQDAMGVLDGNQFFGGLYSGITAQDLIGQIMAGEEFDYYLDDFLQDMPVYGYLPVCTRREAMAQIAFALGAIIDTSYSLRLYIYPKQEEITGEFRKSDIFAGTVNVDHGEIVTGVRVLMHSYEPLQEQTELYKAKLTGGALVTFSEPYHTLEVTGGSISRSGDNYAYLNGTGSEVILKGKKYDHRTVTVQKENPNISRNKNVVSVEAATLVTAHNAARVLERVYDYYTSNQSTTFRAIMAERELGQVVTVDTDFDGVKQGTVEKTSLKFSRNEITAEVTVR